ncbi:hypothetical protein A1Q2_00239 [Trichosporon asahii var. asahii CBS 8904]|uniref:Uncharacterized protein n=1 Tax=Trichosporon asahii var. asahii (strain CBS 8904) TaxID=1220162 RepID=K1W9L6_TRIAC|nr:hypothetical protein A1Q2_00239 [Trichosporon asahii var. asahii CBS 8904]
MKVQLTESAITLRQFKTLINDGTFKVDFSSTTALCFDQVLDLARFLDKYECQFVVRDFIGTLRKKIVGHGGWPSLLFFLSGLILGRPELCPEALNQPASSWQGYSRLWHPKDLKSEEAYCLHPRGIPLYIRDTIPADYILALALARVPFRVGPEGYSLRLGDRFKEVLQVLGDERKSAAEPASKKVKRERRDTSPAPE